MLNTIKNEHMVQNPLLTPQPQGGEHFEMHDNLAYDFDDSWLQSFASPGQGSGLEDADLMDVDIDMDFFDADHDTLMAHFNDDEDVVLTESKKRPHSGLDGDENEGVNCSPSLKRHKGAQIEEFDMVDLDVVADALLQAEQARNGILDVAEFEVETLEQLPVEITFAPSVEPEVATVLDSDGELDISRSADIDAVLSALGTNRGPRSARQVGPQQVGEFPVSDAVVAEVPEVAVLGGVVDISRSADIDAVLSALGGNRGPRSARQVGRQQLRQVPVAAVAAEEEKTDAVVAGEEELHTYKTPAVSECAPAQCTDAEEVTVLEEGVTQPAQKRNKTPTAQHAELVGNFPADLRVMEKSVLNLSEPFEPAGAGHFTNEIAHLRKIEKHTAKLAVIQERLDWVKEELQKDGNSYGWKGGKEPPAGTYELYRGVCLKYIRDRLNHLTSKEVKLGAKGKVKKTASKPAPKKTTAKKTKKASRR